MQVGHESEGRNSSGVVQRVGDAVRSFVAVIPVSTEPPATAPEIRSAELCEAAARMTAKISGLAAMAPGPLGLLTVLPDIVAMWRIQSQLVSDVAAVYGKTGNLSKEHLLWCLFKHSAAQTFRDVAYRVAERFLIQPLTMHALQKLTRAIGVKVSQRTAGEAIARFLPVLGQRWLRATPITTRKRSALQQLIYSAESKCFRAHSNWLELDWSALENNWANQRVTVNFQVSPFTLSCS